MMVLIWIAGIIFFWTSLGVTTFWGFESLYYAWVVVVLSLMSFSMKNCVCCGWGKMSGKMMGHQNMCTHEEGCKCGDCPKCM